jgi:glycosidase
MTFRGIPQLYYGDEILMTGFTNPDGNVRLDFKGGWAEDKTNNKFTREGRTEKEESIHAYLKKLANYRKSSSAIKTGKLMQFYPNDAVYTYFRYDDKQTVIMIMNTGEETRKIDMKRFEERIKGFTKIKDIVTGKILSFDEIELKPMECLVGELVK